MFYHTFSDHSLLASILSSQSYQDVELVTGDLSLRCHRLVLAAAGGIYTKELLRDGGDCGVVVNCHDFTKECVINMKNLVYGGEVQQDCLPEVGRLLKNLLFQREVVGKLIDIGELSDGQETVKELVKIVCEEEVKSLSHNEFDKEQENSVECQYDDCDNQYSELPQKDEEPTKTKQGKGVRKNKISFNKCDQCGKSFGRVTHLNRHIKALHSEKNLQCPHCDYKTSAEHYLQSHLKFKHEVGTDNFYYTCHICGKRVKGRSSYNLHTTTTHTDVRSFFCEVCGNGYKDKGGLVQHMKLHGEKKFSCGVCGEMFKAGFYLNRHMRAKHLERHIQCDLCGDKFVRNFDLKYHKRTIHENNLFSCSVCGVKFKHQSSVHKHLKKNVCSIQRRTEELNYSSVVSLQALSSIQVGIH